MVSVCSSTDADSSVDESVQVKFDAGSTRCGQLCTYFFEFAPPVRSAIPSPVARAEVAPGTEQGDTARFLQC